MRGFVSIEMSVRARRRQAATNKDKHLNHQQVVGVKARNKRTPRDCILFCLSNPYLSAAPTIS